MVGQLSAELTGHGINGKIISITIIDCKYMGFENTLGGHKNPFETRRPSDQRMEDSEHRLEFSAFRTQFNKQAARIFTTGDEFMTELRSHSLFQRLKTDAEFNDENSFVALAAQLSGMDERYAPETQKEQAALLSVLAQADHLQDNRLRKLAAINRAA